MRRRNRTKEALKRVVFLITDHFEPAGYDEHQLKPYFDAYRSLAARHRDYYGNHPKVTWFYLSEKKGVIDAMDSMAREGLGETELHIHHGEGTEMAGVADAESLADLINRRVRILRNSKYPAAGKYGFIHGMWALDNSRRGICCGVNNELRVLHDTGCFADFTFPAWGPMQPAKVNSIYYAKDDPGRPKSYNTGRDVETKRKPEGDLMIFEGPTMSSLEILLKKDVLNTKIVDSWIRSHICVVGCEEWIFVKSDIHSLSTVYKERIFTVKILDDIFSYLEKKYNDGNKYTLHYATAREAYNIVKAAEDGMRGNPEDYRDYSVKPYFRKND